MCVPEDSSMANTRSVRRPATAHGIKKRLARLEAQIAKLTRTPVNVRREEHQEVITALRQLEQHTRDLDVQFKRMAQMQADLDELKRAWDRMKAPL